MRFNELWEGIEVMDRDGKIVGTSLIAAKMVSRVVLTVGNVLQIASMPSLWL